ncbi:hypothetical protein [Streptacidiphilus sp. P02-A3a]|uniref:hypothetical protein n=1 Tax=Streptacidiphilus sp. P02-A3a TaxID=2704468 RepID=UPI0015FAFAFA|nr:hypothetical protein [Streptacidiphilus sp. P02-A3a]QMU71886.1 hypothetical protein GXP74_30275 [Streptacidiphilus sp. P02-A3a]
MTEPTPPRPVPVVAAHAVPGAGGGFEGRDGVEETGVAGVDAALARLEGLAEVPSEEHAAVFEAVHEQLRQTLAGLDQPHPQATGRQ